MSHIRTSIFPDLLIFVPYYSLFLVLNRICIYIFTVHLIRSTVLFQWQRTHLRILVAMVTVGILIEIIVLNQQRGMSGGKNTRILKQNKIVWKSSNFGIFFPDFCRCAKASPNVHSRTTTAISSETKRKRRYETLWT